MDLFGRKARAEVSVLEAMLAERGNYLNGAVALLAERDKEVKSLQAKLFIAKLDVELKEIRAKQEANKVPTMRTEPLYFSEDQEDLKFQLDSNLIDYSTYNQLLKELEFENAEVSLAVEDLPESFHY